MVSFGKSLRTMTVATIVATSMAITIAVSGCGTDTPPPANTTNGTGPTTALIGDPSRGMQLFQQNCSGCHSTGTDTIVGPGLANLYSRSSLPNGNPVTTQNVMNWIQTGGGEMPSFAQLSAQDRADLAAYLKTLK